MAVDWQTGKTPLQCTEYMLDNQLYCDVNFLVGENEENIKAHKLILSIRSAVFDRMFNGSFCEADIDPVIPDVTPAAFKTLLRYCYHESVDIEDDVALTVLYAATKYMLPLLEEAARKKLIDTLSGSNIWEVYRYALDVGDTGLLEGCRMFFKGNITPVKEALQDEAFLNIPHNILLKFLHINDEVDNVNLNQNLGNAPESNPDPSKTNQIKKNMIPRVFYKNLIGISISEIELFKACNAWAEAECLRQDFDQTGANKRTVLGECLSLIRFPTMLPKDLATIVYTTGILTPEEVINLGQYIHKDPTAECRFPSRQRPFVVTSPETSERVVDISTMYVETTVRVMLSRLWMMIPGSYRVTLSNLSRDSSSSMKYYTKFQGHLTKLIRGERKLLDSIEIKPLLLEPGIKYSITTDRINRFDPPPQALVTKWIHIEDLPPFNEVKLTCDHTNKNHIYALTMRLI